MKLCCYTNSDTGETHNSRVAVIEVNPQHISDIRDRAILFNKIHEKDRGLAEMRWVSYAVTYFASITDPGEATPEEDWVRAEKAGAQGAQRVEGEVLVISAGGTFWWEARPKHTSTTVETVCKNIWETLNEWEKTWIKEAHERHEANRDR